MKCLRSKKRLNSLIITTCVRWAHVVVCIGRGLGTRVYRGSCNFQLPEKEKSFSVLQCPYNELSVNGPEDKTHDT
jgi:hypothetical protein